MASKELISRYKLYKSKTNGLLYWLTKTAGTCIDLKAVVKSWELPPSETEKKNHAPTPAVELRTTELIKLAEVIAAASPPVEIPEGIILIVQDVIHGREEAAAWYAAQALEDGGKLERENETHRYFILVLRRVLSILKEARVKIANVVEEAGTSYPKFEKGKKTQTEDDILSSVFYRLELEEPSLNPLENEHEDSAFEVFCFLQDLADVRKSVRQAWLDYAAGDLSFLAASSITDTAFGLLHLADEDFKAHGPLGGSGVHNILELIGLNWFWQHNAIWMHPDEQHQMNAPRIPDAQVNVVDLLCPIACAVVWAFREEATDFCQVGKLPKDQQQARFEQNAFTTWAGHRYHDFCRILSDLDPQIHRVAHPRCHHEADNVLDEFIHGLIDVHSSGQASMWIVVATQVYLDIHELMGKHLDQGIHHLQDAYQRTKELTEDLKEYRDVFHDQMLESLSVIQTVEWVASTASRFEQLIEDVERDCRTFSSRQAREQEVLGPVATLMERSLPAHTGAILTDLKIELYATGCQIANQYSIVLTAAHLYKGLRNMGALQVDWHDMDFCIASFGTRRPLVSKTKGPWNGEAAARRYHLALGISAQDFASNARSKRTTLRESRKLEMTSPLLQKLYERRQDCSTRGLGRKSKTKVIQSVLQALAADEASTLAKSCGRGSHLRDTFTSSQLLTTFRARLLRDEPVLNFDFVRFTLSCLRLLRELQLDVGPLVGLSDPRDDPFHFDLVTRLLWSSGSSKEVRTATYILQAYIDSEGKALIKQAYDQSSGRIPSSLRPNLDIDLELVVQADSRRWLSTLLDYAGTKYSYSGKMLAACHPGIKRGCNCENHDHSLAPTSDETHPSGCYNDDVLIYGSRIPRAIREAAE